MNEGLFGGGGLIFLSVYLLALIAVGIAGRKARKENSLSDFYLGGRSMGLFVLFLTLYATQYSGNTLIGFAGSAYRQGYYFIVSVTFMMAVIGAYMVYAPRLQILASRHSFITLGDFIQHRFGSRTLTAIASMLCIAALGNYVLSNLKAIGFIIEAATGGAIPFIYGIIILSVVMLIYETLGGMRSVAWTDAIQGILLFIGCATIFVLIEMYYNGVSGAAEKLMSTRVDLWSPPTAIQNVTWLSTLAIVFFGISIYPHAIQRIYAAKNARTLRRSLQIMVFMPLFTTFFMIVVGVVGAAVFPDLDRADSERITLLLLGDMAAKIPGADIVVIVFITAAIAAIMSTVDSALLAISSLFTQDIYRPVKPNASQASLTRAGKRCSWIVMAIAATLAISLPNTIWQLIQIKLELLCQAAPALFLGIHIRSLKATPVLWGLISGVLVTLILMVGTFAGFPIPAKPLGIHAGIWGLTVNLGVIGLASIRTRRNNN